MSEPFTYSDGSTEVTKLEWWLICTHPEHPHTRQMYTDKIEATYWQRMSHAFCGEHVRVVSSEDRWERAITRGETA